MARSSDDRAVEIFESQHIFGLRWRASSSVSGPLPHVICYSSDGSGAGRFPRLSIHVRPPEVEDRILPGHWEGDFIKGLGNKSSVGVLVERSSRLVLLAKMDDATAASALAGFSAKLNSIAAPLRQSLTYDQGKEMSRHRDLSANTGVKVYFCDPHSPWQRRTCENINGLLRQ